MAVTISARVPTRGRNRFDGAWESAEFINQSLRQHSSFARGSIARTVGSFKRRRKELARRHQGPRPRRTRSGQRASSPAAAMTDAVCRDLPRLSACWGGCGRGRPRSSGTTATFALSPLRALT